METTNLKDEANGAACGRMKRLTGLAWLGFWIFLSVFVLCDHWIFSQGYNSFFHSHKTPEEKEIQQLKIQKLRDEVDKRSPSRTQWLGRDCTE